MHTDYQFPNSQGFFGKYGGQYLPETLIAPIQELTKVYYQAIEDSEFQATLTELLHHYCGRPTPLDKASNWTKHLGGAQIYLKREDLLHTGAHKINNAIGQALLAKRLGKKRIIAETGAGQHGVATATACAKLDLDCVIYMGAVDMKRQALNVARMRLLGAEVRPVTVGQATLKEAVNEALRDWVTSVETTHYILGSALGPHPFPMIVRDFHRIIGVEARQQCLERTGKLPDTLVACVGGGSNAMGLFHAFIDDENVAMIGVEAGGHGIKPEQHAARFQGGQLGILQGSKTWLLADSDGQIQKTHSISAGLDYAAVGPEHAYLKDIKRADYHYVTDEEVLDAFQEIADQEGILPALESAHAIAYVKKLAPTMSPDQTIIINLSGRGDKDVEQVVEALNMKL